MMSDTIYEDVPDKVDGLRKFTTDITAEFKDFLKEHSVDTQTRQHFDGHKVAVACAKKMKERWLKTNEPKYIYFCDEAKQSLEAHLDNARIAMSGEGGSKEHMADLVLEFFKKCAERYPEDD